MKPEKCVVCIQYIQGRDDFLRNINYVSFKLMVISISRSIEMTLKIDSACML